MSYTRPEADIRAAFQASGFSISAAPHPSFPRKRESTAADALLLQPEAIYPITYQYLCESLLARSLLGN